MSFLEERREFEKNIVIKNYPYSVSVESTAYCNLRCKMCANSTMKRKKGHMDMGVFKNIVDQVVAHFPQSNFWMNGYGEPLLHPRFIEMAEYASRRGLKTFVNTNAMLLDDEKADSILRTGIYGIVVSIDGFSKEVYESVRCGGDRDIVYYNVLNILEKIKTVSGKKPYFEIQFIEMPDILDEKEVWFEFWKGKGANIKFKSYATWGGTVDKRENMLTERMACGDCNVLDILWDGRVPYCSTGDVECKYLLGNVNTDTLVDIWERKRCEFCEYHIMHKFDKLPLSCQSCTDWMAMPAKHLY